MIFHNIHVGIGQFFASISVGDKMVGSQKLQRQTFVSE